MYYVGIQKLFSDSNFLKHSLFVTQTYQLLIYSIMG